MARSSRSWPRISGAALALARAAFGQHSISRRAAAVVVMCLAPTWLVLFLPLWVTPELGWAQPLAVTLPPFVFAVASVACAHSSPRHEPTRRRRAVLACAYLEVAVFALLLAVGINNINNQGWGG